MSPKSLLLLCLLCCASFAGAKNPEKDMTGNDLFDKPDKQFEFINLKYLSKGEALIVPTLYLDVLTYGKGTARAETSGLQAMRGKEQSTVKATAEAIIPLDGALYRQLASQLYDDFVTQLRAQGWTVYTREDVKDDPIVQKMKLHTPDKDFGEPSVKWTDGITKKEYLRFAPEGFPVFENNLTGPLFKLKKLAAQKSATLVLPTLGFDPAQLQLSAERGYSSLSASAGVAPELILANASYAFLNPKNAGGAIYGKEIWQVLNPEAGVLVEQKDASPEFANALSAALSALSSSGSISSKKGQYVIQPDRQVMTTEILRAGVAANDIAARAIGLYH
ncbi:MAG: hypothetical protein KDC10_03265 [Calditrichaeota bacterium]|nr:hypothetical protein [Calditrichota bacterium]